MQLVAKSGTPLFISAQPEAINSEQRQTIKHCLALASRNLPVGEPIDWMENLTPSITPLIDIIFRLELQHDAKKIAVSYNLPAANSNT